MDKKLEETSKDLASDLNALRDDITKLSASVAELVKSQAATASDTFRGAVDTARGAVDTARQKMSESAAGAQDKMGAVGADLETAIEKNPIMALLIALGTGLIMGLLSRPRR